MIRSKDADYKAREEFIRQVEEWRLSRGYTMKDMLTVTHSRSKASYSIWIRPENIGEPLISMSNVAYLSKLTGIKYVTSSEKESDEYSEAYKSLGKVSIKRKSK